MKDGETISSQFVRKEHSSPPHYNLCDHFLTVLLPLQIPLNSAYILFVQLFSLVHKEHVNTNGERTSEALTSFDGMRAQRHSDALISFSSLFVIISEMGSF